jgi:hypothetical protein
VKYRITFDNHAPVIFTIEEIINGAVYFFCSKNNCIVKDYSMFSGRTRNGVDFYEGDVVVCEGTKRVGEYETKIVINRFPCKLEDNKTYLTNEASLSAIKHLSKSPL